PLPLFETLMALLGTVAPVVRLVSDRSPLAKVALTDSLNCTCTEWPVRYRKTVDCTCGAAVSMVMISGADAGDSILPLVDCVAVMVCAPSASVGTPLVVM